MTSASGGTEFCFLSALHVSVSPRGTLRLSRQQSALFPLGSMIKYLSGIATVTEKMELPLDCLTTVQKNNGEKS